MNTHKITLGTTLLLAALSIGAVRYGPLGSTIRETGARIDNVLRVGDETLPQVQTGLESFTKTMDEVSTQYNGLETHIDYFSDRLNVDEAVAEKAKSLDTGSQEYIQGLSNKVKESRFNLFSEESIDKITTVTREQASSTIASGAESVKTAVPEVPRVAFERVGNLVDDTKNKAHVLRTQANQMGNDYNIARENMDYRFESLLPNLATGLVAIPFVFFLAGYGVAYRNGRKQV